MGSDQLTMLLNVCTLTIILLTAHLLILRSNQYQTYLALAVCFLCVGFILAKPVIGLLIPNAQLYWLIISLPVLLFIAPSFWLYVKGLTHNTPWRFKRSELKHFYTATMGLLIAVSALLLPSDLLNSIVSDDGNSTDLLKHYPVILSYWIDFLLMITFLLILGFVLQSGYYCLKIFKRLKNYNHHLKDLFASTESKELRWMRILLTIIGAVWLMTATNIIWNNVFHINLINQTWIDVIILVMVWILSIWGLRQKPGFEELYDSSTNSPDAVTELLKTKKKKYERSALDKSQSQIIAQTIIKAMVNEQLYLDNELSLQKLARQINTPANYISQTLNSTIGMNFFDFVNTYRIDRAKKLLTSRSMAVIDIAFEVGFNAKSSFYKAFKKNTAITPSEFRKQHRLNKNKLNT